MMEVKNINFLMFEELLKRFEDYEHAVRNNAPTEEIVQCTNQCINIIDDVLYANSNYDLQLYLIREELCNHIRKLDSRKYQIILNDVTITRINNNSCEPLDPPPRLISSQTQSTSEVNKPDKLLTIIKNTLVSPKCTGLAEIAGLKHAKSLLWEAIIVPIKYPHLYTDGRKIWNKALLYGPPGTGKTQLAHCLAAEINTPLYCVTNSDLWSSYVGESEKLIKTLFKYCQENNKKCIIFIDEIDSICRTRNSKESELERRFKNELLTHLSEMDRNKNNVIFFLACTNCPWDLDPAFIRRFQRRIYVPLPDRETRVELLNIQAKNILNSEQWNEIANETEGWSGSDITDLVNFAMNQPIRELQTADEWILTEDNYYMPIKNSKNSTLRLTINDIPPEKVKLRSVQLSDFFLGLRNLTRTVCDRDLHKFEYFNESYGSLRNVTQTQKD